MATLHHNISGEITAELVEPGLSAQVSSISIANIHDDTACYVDLYIEKISTGKFYFFKNLDLPPGTTLIKSISFNNAKNQFGLYIKLTKSASETPAVDVILQ
jgi:hypothetical protein